MRYYYMLILTFLVWLFCLFTIVAHAHEDSVWTHAKAIGPCYGGWVNCGGGYILVADKEGLYHPYLVATEEDGGLRAHIIKDVVIKPGNCEVFFQFLPIIREEKSYGNR